MIRCSSSSEVLTMVILTLRSCLSVESGQLWDHFQQLCGLGRGLSLLPTLCTLQVENMNRLFLWFESEISCKYEYASTLQVGRKLMEKIRLIVTQFGGLTMTRKCGKYPCWSWGKEGDGMQLTSLLIIMQSSHLFVSMTINGIKCRINPLFENI